VAGSLVVKWVALLAMLAAVVLAPYCGPRQWPTALFAPAAAAFLVAFYFTYDPYYAPQLYRYSEGNLAPVWIAVVAAIAVANGVLTWLQPRIGRFTTSGVLVLVVVATVLAGTGH
jgi:hypothetical protein